MMFLHRAGTSRGHQPVIAHSSQTGQRSKWINSDKTPPDVPSDRSHVPGLPRER